MGKYFVVWGILFFACSFSWAQDAKFASELIDDLAAKPTPSLPSFCDDPYASICGTEGRDQQIIAERRARIEGFNQRVTVEAARRYLARIEPGQNAGATETQLLGYAQTWTGNSASDDTVKDYGRQRTQVRTEFLSPLMEAERRRTGFIQSLFRGALPSPIHESRISSIRFHTPEEVQALFASFPEIQFDLQNLYVLSCAPNGMEQMAYALPSYREGIEPFLVVCPGTVVAQSSEQGDGRNERATALSSFQVIAHELSHAIDSQYFPQEFENYGRCLVDGFAEELRRSSPRSEGASVSPTALAARQMPEIAADLRATVAVARLIELMDQQMQRRHWNQSRRYEVKSKALRKMYELFCGDAPENGLHPTGRLRVGTLLGGDTRVRRAMGCRQTPADGLWLATRCSL